MFENKLVLSDDTRHTTDLLKTYTEKKIRFNTIITYKLMYNLQSCLKHPIMIDRNQKNKNNNQRISSYLIRNPNLVQFVLTKPQKITSI